MVTYWQDLQNVQHTALLASHDREYCTKPSTVHSGEARARARARAQGEMAMATGVTTAALCTRSTLPAPSASTHSPPRTPAPAQCSSLCHISRSWQLTGANPASEFGHFRWQSVCVYILWSSEFFIILKHSGVWNMEFDLLGG
jgi:hypothetical protein